VRAVLIKNGGMIIPPFVFCTPEVLARANAAPPGVLSRAIL